MHSRNLCRLAAAVGEMQRLARCGSQAINIVRQVIQYAVTGGCYVVLVTNGFNLFAFRSEVVMEFCPVRFNPAPLVHINTNLVYRRVMS